MSGRTHHFNKNQYLIQIDPIKITSKSSELIKQLNWILSNCELISKAEDRNFASSKMKYKKMAQNEIKEKKFRNLETMIG